MTRKKIAVISLALAASAFGQDAGPSHDPQQFLNDPAKPSTLKGPFTLVAIGDLLYSHPEAQSADPDVQKVFDLLKTGDATIGNREGPIFDMKTFKGQAYGDGNVWGDATVGKDMKAMGVNMVSVANNHSTDWGPEGVIDCLSVLDQAGIVHAGGGHNLQEARAAGILTTPKGKVGLVATASSFKVNAGANDPFGGTPERAGISILRTQVVNLCPPDQMEKVRALATERASPHAPAPKPDATEITLGGATITTSGQIYRAAPKAGLYYDMDLYDHAGLLKAVREAKEKTDLVVFTIHAHESATGTDDDTPEPPDFLVTLFHDAVDAGADEIIGGGPHSLRGVEIYKGKPILYGMGLFILRTEIRALQETAFREFPGTRHGPQYGMESPLWGGMAAVTEFQDGKAKTVRLYPLDLDKDNLPRFAQGEVGSQMLARLQKDSEPFGTRIEIEGTIGVIQIP
jgi:poly-gamma-glutamate capsule biosynthesis protein CapA/YwtB (metallophosphatase superfamily)